MFRPVFALLALLVATAGARMAYQLPDGAESILKARTFTQNFDCADRRYGYVKRTCAWRIYRRYFNLNSERGTLTAKAEVRGTYKYFQNKINNATLRLSR
jgi:hypothetical protein